MTNKENRCPEKIDLLLPWYVKGTLSPQQRSEVEAHLESCAFCQKELEKIKAELRVLEGVEEDIEVPWTLEELESVLGPQGWWERFKNSVAGHPTFFLTGFVLQGILVLALIFVLLFHVQGKKYATLSSRGSGRAQVVVIFDGNVREKEMRKVLLNVGATIVEGPSPQGAYHLGFSRPLSVRSLTEVLNRLRKAPGVKFAAKYHGKD